MKENTLSLDCGIEVIFGGVQPMSAKAAEKAENHRKEGPINATVGKSGD